jgi:hypothetical protein
VPTRYTSTDEDSGRWDGFRFRDGDIVISARSKTGTTWVQTICALFVHGRPPFPEPLGRLSPWVDHLIEPREALMARLAAQPWRRVMKTHTPLDGVPLDPHATYVVVARHPLDAAVSLYHQGDNLDRRRLAELTGGAAPVDRIRPPLQEWLRQWIRADADPRTSLDSLRGHLWHAADAWQRRETANVVLVHYADLQHDLPGEMRRLAGRLGVDVADSEWPALAAAADFTNMQREAAHFAPAAGGVLRSTTEFFRRGRSGSGRELLTASELTDYRRRVAALAPGELLAWLHR